MLKYWFHRAVLSRRWLTFLVMGLAFFAFGAGSYNLVMLFGANAEVISSYGWQALKDGAAQQFAELVITGYLSLAAYVVFKTCEYRLAHDLSDGISERHANAAATKPVDETSESREGAVLAPKA